MVCDYVFEFIIKNLEFEFYESFVYAEKNDHFNFQDLDLVSRKTATNSEREVV